MALRTFAFLFAMAVGLGSAVLAYFVGHPLAAWGCGLVGGALIVIANVLTNPLIVRWDA